MRLLLPFRIKINYLYEYKDGTLYNGRKSEKHQKSGGKPKKCNLTLAMSPTCNSNNTITICWDDFFWECSESIGWVPNIRKQHSVSYYKSIRVAPVKLDFYRNMTCWLANFFLEYSSFFLQIGLWMYHIVVKFQLPSFNTFWDRIFVQCDFLSNSLVN